MEAIPKLLSAQVTSQAVRGCSLRAVDDVLQPRKHERSRSDMASTFEGVLPSRVKLVVSFGFSEHVGKGQQFTTFAPNSVCECFVPVGLERVLTQP